EPPGVRMPGESTYSTGRRRARRLATWWLLVRFSACQSLPTYTTPSPCNPALAGCSLIAPPAHQPGNAAGMDPVLAQARDALQVRFHPPEAGRGDETGHQAGLAQVAHPLDRRPGITRVIKHLAGGDQVEPMALLAPGLSEDVTGGELRLRGALPCPGDRLAAHVDAVDLVRHFGEPAGLVAFPAPQFQQRANPAERLLDDRVGGVEARVLQLGIHVPGVLDGVGQFQALVVVRACDPAQRILHPQPPLRLPGAPRHLAEHHSSPVSLHSPDSPAPFPPVPASVSRAMCSGRNAELCQAITRPQWKRTPDGPYSPSTSSPDRGGPSLARTCAA